MMSKGLELLAVMASLAVGSIATAQTAGDDEAATAATMRRLNFELPAEVSGREPVKRHLRALSREPCDKQAIIDLGVALDRVGHRREAAKAHVAFSGDCGPYAPSLRAAVNYLLTLSDHARAAALASELVAIEPFSDNGYFLRALANDRAGQPKTAIDDYVTAIELFGDKRTISSVGYFALAKAHEKLGQFCDAIDAIETWVALDPTSHDTSKTRAIIANYAAKAKCAPAAGRKEEVLKISRPGTITLQVSVNGQQGNFLLDTGATYVTMKSEFAKRAKVGVDESSNIRLSTANGIVSAKLGRASVVQWRSLEAKNVPIAVQVTAPESYGDKIDGLLGMSFLSRFKFSLDAQTLRVSRK